MKHMNKIISIGYLGIKRCYLNISKHAAINKYCKSENISIERFEVDDIPIDIIEFDDEFGTYSIHE